MTLDDIPLPPIHVRRAEEGLLDCYALLTGKGDPLPWTEGAHWVDAQAPSGRYLGANVSFPDGCDAATAHARVANIRSDASDRVAMWLDSDTPWNRKDPLPEAPTLEGPSACTLSEVAGTGGRMLLVSGAPGTTAILLSRTATGAPVRMTARPGDLACLTRQEHMHPRWIVLPDLDLAGAYWLFSLHDAFEAMNRIARAMLARHAEGPVPIEAAAVVGHAALRLRYLGVEFRTKALAYLARCDAPTTDAAALEWCIIFDSTEMDGFAARTDALCARLVESVPTHSATLWYLWERLHRSVRSYARAGGTSPLHAEATAAVHAVAREAYWSNALIATGRIHPEG